MTKAISLFVAALMSFAAALAHAQASLAQLKAELVSAWVVTVDGEARKRLLRISGIEQGDNERFPLTATYGWIDGSKPSVRAEIVQSGKDRALNLTTGSSSKIVATQNAEGVFVGTFAPTSGPVKPIRLVRISDDELPKILAEAQAGVPIVKPAESVPPACAAYSGRWTGTWGYGTGQTWLTVVEIDSNCMARFAYLFNSRPPTRFESAEIKKGELSVSCGNGTCTFEVHGDEIWGRYSGPEGTNSVVKKKIP
ncbi:MAG: hypothetical protein IPH39_02240 [Sulfuritalea sp.]|nr:hypothetical protein [Sulfuritalea sp.]MBK9349222.1 hypothetical protein [Sulfuritalea sp.]